MTTDKPQVFKTQEKKRHGKGFSREELKKAGTNMADASKLRIPLDPRRKTAHGENIEVVKSLIAQRKAITQKKADQKLNNQKPKKAGKKSKK